MRMQYTMVPHGTTNHDSLATNNAKCGSKSQDLKGKQGIHSKKMVALPSGKRLQFAMERSTHF